MKFEGFEKNKQCVMVIFLHNQYILINTSALRASINFFWFWTITNHMLKKTLKISGAHGHQVARKDQPGCPRA